MQAEKKSTMQYYFDAIKNTAAASTQEILGYSYHVLEAIPAFIGTQLSRQAIGKPKAPPFFSQLMHLSRSDLLLMMFVHWAAAMLTKTAQNDDNNYFSIPAWLGLCLISIVSSIIILRQQIRFFMHATILSIAYSKAYSDVTKTVREKVDASVCKPCTPGRYLKGDLRAAIVYLSQKLAITGLEFIPYIGFWLAQFSRIVLTGQVLSEYRLANDGLCDRHRAEYFHQHHRFVFTLGLMHYGMTKLLAAQTEWIPGLNRAHSEGPIDTILLMFFIGLVHHMRFPASVARATRHFYDPLMLIRAYISILIDLITPGVKKLFDNTTEKKKEKMSWECFRYHMIALYRHRITQISRQLLLPSACRDFREFQNDPIIKNYWPAVSEKLADYMGRILAMRDPALKIDSLRQFYMDYVAPIQEVADMLGFFLALSTPVILPLKIVAKSVGAISVGSGLQKRAAKILPAIAQRNEAATACMEFINSMPKGLGFLIIAALRSKAFIADFEALRNQLGTMAADYYSEKVQDLPEAPLPPTYEIKACAEEGNFVNLSLVKETPKTENPIPQKSPSELFKVVTQDEVRQATHPQRKGRAKIVPSSDDEFERVTSDEDTFNEMYSSNQFRNVGKTPTAVTATARPMAL